MDKQELEILLRQLKADTSPSEFTDGIMEMIQDEALSPETSAILSNNTIKERAPMHMTNLIMESITPTIKKDPQIINSKEVRNLVIVLVLTLIIGWIAAPQATLLQTTNLWLTMVDHIPWSVLVAFGIGSMLWIGDYFLRERVFSAGK